MKYTVGLMTILEGNIRDEVINLWDYFEQKYDSKAVKAFKHPNLSYQGGVCDDLDALISQLDKYDFPSKFEIECDGFDKFIDPQKTIFIKIIGNDILRNLHIGLSRVLTNTCLQTFNLYNPEKWVPHITLVMNDIPEANFYEAFDELCKNETDQKSIEIGNLALVTLNSTTQELEITKIWGLK